MGLRARPLRSAARPLCAVVCLVVTLAGCVGGNDADPTALPTQATTLRGQGAATPLASPMVASPVASPGAAAATARSIDRGDAARTGVYPGRAPAGEPALLWRADAGNDVSVSPVVAGGVVYAVGGANLFAFDLATGSRLWRSPIIAESAPAVVNGTVYVGGMAGAVPALYALDAATGQERWHVESDCGRARASTSRICTLGTSPLVVGDLVFAGSPNGDLLAVDAATGAERWTADFDGVVSTLAYVDGALVAAATIDRVVSVDAATGAERWETTVGDWPSAPAIAVNRVYVSTQDEVVALDLATGATLWTVEVEGDPGTPAVSAGVVFVGTGQASHLVALDAATGVTRWRLDLGDPIYAPPSVAGGIVVVESGHDVLALDAATGAERWRFDVGDLSTASVAIVDGVVYAGSHDDHLYAIAAS